MIYGDDNMAEKSDKPEKVEKKQKADAPVAEATPAAAPKKGGKKDKAAKPEGTPAEGAQQGKKQPKTAKKPAAEEKPKDEIKYIVRIANIDLDGTAKVQYALTGITGVGIRVSKIIARKAEVDPNATMGYLPPEQVERLKNVVDNIEAAMPLWMLNRRNDTYTGENRHLIGTDLLMGVKEDINLMKKMRSYKGIRHERGQKVRGQRTRSTGRTGATVGVVRKKETAQGAAEGKKEDKK
jgi:small subunit ribosomal protein S13